jgi:hypothetical protein
MSFGLLAIWYVFCAMLTALVLFSMRGLTHSKFRDDAGDRTTEIGYEEDSEGHDLHGHEEANTPRQPHVAVTPGARA